MTRGQIAIITGENELHTSIEFNGDMYMPTKKWAGHGRQVINLLKKVKDVADYQYIVAKFNCENHHYCDCERLTYKCEGEKAKSMLNFFKDYFTNWFSDYVYLKNISGKEVTIIQNNYNEEGTNDKAEEVTIPNNAIVVLCFGKVKKIIEEKEKE